jgi:hypothetical protein
MHILTARVHKIRVLSKWKHTLKRQILEEENINSMTGHSLSANKVIDKKNIHTYRYKYRRLDEIQADKYFYIQNRT